MVINREKGVSRKIKQLENSYEFLEKSLFEIDWQTVVNEYCKRFRLPSVKVKISFNNSRVVRRKGTYSYNKRIIRVYASVGGTKVTTLVHELAHHLQYSKYRGLDLYPHDSYFHWAYIESLEWLITNRKLLNEMKTVEIDKDEYEKLKKLMQKRRK